jgi:predicted dehydrogenase
VSVGALGVGIVGCGTIADAYARDITSYPELELVGATDLDPERARALTEQHGGRPYEDLGALLGDDRVELVANLTVHQAHFGVTEACLGSGRHVYSEKPLAMSVEDARLLVERAADRGLRLGCSPCTLMGEAQQTAWKLVREGRLGEVRLVYAEANGGRIEAWHPAPLPFYEAGALFDIGVYPLTILTGIFGPARRVQAAAKTLSPERRLPDGTTFRLAVPDFTVVLLELESGALVRLTANFYAPRRGPQKTLIEMHGDVGSLALSSWQFFDATVDYAPFGQEYEPVELVAPGHHGTEFGRGIRDLAQAIEEGRPHRSTGEHAAHVVEIICAAAAAAERDEPVDVVSSFAAPEPLPWAR